MLRFFLTTIFAATLSLSGCSGDAVPWHARDIDGLMPQLAFTLTDARGMPARAADYRGKVVLLYFGFTHCTDVCPTTLATLSRAVRGLGRDAAGIRILFVSVDPQRDTPAVLQRYAAHFSPWVVGLSGKPKQLDALAQRYRVSYSYGKRDAGGDYEVYHSSAVFVFDRNGRVRLLVDPQQGAAAIAEDLRRLLDAPA